MSNEERPHEGLSNQVPASLYIPNSIRPPRKLPEFTYPKGLLLRRVNNSGDISWHKNRVFISEVFRFEELGVELMEVPGSGPIISTALVAAIGNGISFRKGRDLAAWLGLVPRQHSTGGKTRLLGISKLGNEYLRRIMLHGAHSVVMQMERKPSALGEWLTNLSARRHRNVTVVALANKMARIAWAILTKGTHCAAPALAAA